nr:hypothetical protein BgiMline_012177 [Biomphalaria glabrata]
MKKKSGYLTLPRDISHTVSGHFIHPPADTSRISLSLCPASSREQTTDEIVFGGSLKTFSQFYVTRNIVEANSAVLNLSRKRLKFENVPDYLKDDELYVCSHRDLQTFWRESF